jgi:GTP-binding protein
MIVKNASFVIGAVSPKQYPDTGYSEISLCGRSNVGKSSLINKLINRRNLARTSSQPGKTRQLNYYLVQTDTVPFYFVDLPGYGFARTGKEERLQWSNFIEKYLIDRDRMTLVLQIIDIRHKPTKDDVQMYQWLQYYGKNVCVVATKADKISRGQYARAERDVRTSLGMPADAPLLVFSAETGYGLDKLNALVEDNIK